MTWAGASVGAFVIALVVGCAAQRPAPHLGVFVPTPTEIVERMLTLADVTRDDVVYDLGSGDGRIVNLAAERYGTRRGRGDRPATRLVRPAQRDARGVPVPCVDDPNCHNRFHPAIPAVARANPGDVVVFETRDAFDNQLNAHSTPADVAALDASRVHPLTGPSSRSPRRPARTSFWMPTSRNRCWRPSPPT